VELGRLDPTEEAVPPPASLDVYSRAGPHALLGLSTFRALPPEEPEAGLLSPTSPLPFFPPNGLAAARERNLRGFRLFRPGISLRRGRRPVWPFPPTALCCPLGSPPAAGYFFASGTQAPLRELEMALLAADVLPPNGRQRTRFGAARGSLAAVAPAVHTNFTRITGQLVFEFVFSRIVADSPA
jgi:hypothetical protein